MLSRRMVVKPWNQSLSRTFVKQFSTFDSSRMRKFRPFATSSLFDDDYEIDLISMKKTHIKHDESPDTLYFKRVKQALFDKTIGIKDELLEKKDNPDNKKFEKNDQKEFLDFVQRYYDEMQVFLKFLMESYNGKISSFGQLTSTELLNSLYVFKDFYTKSKIPQVNRYNYISYNYMFTRLLKYLTRFPDFPQVLTNELFPNVKNGQMILTLYKNRIINFTDELHSLSNEFNFFELTLSDLSKKIGLTLSKFDDFVSQNSEFDAKYFQVIIQARRYLSLKQILELAPDLEAKHLLLLINDPDLPVVSLKIWEISDDKTTIENTFKKYRKELDFVKFAFKGQKINDFSELSALVYNEASSSVNSSDAKDIFNNVLCGLLTLYGKGLLKCDNIDFLKDDYHLIKIVISEDIKVNYETSLIYDLGIYKYIDCLRYLNSFMGGMEFATKLEIEQSLSSLIKSFEDNKIISERLLNLEKLLLKFFLKIPWSQPNLSLIVQDSSIYLSLCNIDPTNEVIDITSRTKDSREPMNESLSQQLSYFSHELAVFKEKDLGGMSFSDSLFDVIINLLKASSIEEHKKERLLSILSECDDKDISLSFLDEISKEGNRSQKPYLQVPDELQIHSFYKELDFLRNQILKKSFAASSPKDVLSSLDKHIEELTANGTFVPNQSLARLVKMRNRLERLFNYNGGYTEVLDTIIQSQAVFDNLENRLLDKQSKEYKQVPDDFFLEQYFTEISQLKDAIGLPFAKVSSLLVLQKLEVLMNEEINIEKKVIWRKLLSNLANLFRLNNNCTFVLDDILMSGERFVEFEAQLSYNKLMNHNSVIGKHLTFFNVYFDDISDILKSLNLLDKIGIWNMSEPEFSRILQYHLGTLDKSLPGYQFKKFLIESMKEYNFQIEYYPNFLQQLFEIKENNFHIVLSAGDTEEIYKALIENIEYEKVNQDEIVLPEQENIEESENQVNETDDKLRSSSLYRNSEEVLSNLIKNEASVELDSNNVLRDIDFRAYSEADSKVKDAISTALKGSTGDISFKGRTSNIKGNSFKKNRGSFEREGAVDPVKIDKSSVENFLLNAQKEKKFEKERKFRESKAYDWSKSMYNSHRSLEAHNFFNPLYDFNLKGASIPTKIPKLEKTEEGNEYLVLLLDGKTIKSDVNPLGREPAEDIFKVLNKFDKREMNRFLKHFKKLQRRNWKLIGSKNIGDDQKYLILWRNYKPVSVTSRVWKKLKLVLAATGAVFTLLLGLDYWASSETQQNIPPSFDSNDFNAERTPDSLHEVVEVIDDKPPTSTFIKKLMWKTD